MFGAWYVQALLLMSSRTVHLLSAELEFLLPAKKCDWWEWYHGIVGLNCWGKLKSTCAVQRLRSVLTWLSLVSLVCRVFHSCYAGSNVCEVQAHACVWRSNGQKHHTAIVGAERGSKAWVVKCGSLQQKQKTLVSFLYLFQGPRQ